MPAPSAQRRNRGNLLLLMLGVLLRELSIWPQTEPMKKEATTTEKKRRDSQLRRPVTGARTHTASSQLFLSCANEARLFLTPGACHSASGLFNRNKCSHRQELLGGETAAASGATSGHRIVCTKQQTLHCHRSHWRYLFTEMLATLRLGALSTHNQVSLTLRTSQVASASLTNESQQMMSRRKKRWRACLHFLPERRGDSR